MKLDEHDFNLHGIVTVRFINAAPGIIASFDRRWQGALLPTDNREPDIVVTFHETLAPHGLTYIGENWAAFNEEAFYLLDETTGEIRAGISFETIGDRCEMSCPRNTASVPLLGEIVNLTCLQKEHVPLHASAVTYEGSGILLAAWSKGGKTGALLTFMNHGARFVADEWVILSADGQSMRGIPESIAISEWQFAEIPAFMPAIGLQKRLFFGSVHALDFAYERVLPRKSKESFLGKMLRKSLPRLKRQLKIYKAPRALFGDRFGPLQARPDVFFLMSGHAQPFISVEPCDARTFALRMAQVNEYEWRDFFDYYRAFKFAFPHLENAFLENALALQESLLCQALESKETVSVLHPYGERLEPLFAKMKSCVKKPPSNAVASPQMQIGLENRRHANS
ncbi:MAG TPA: hypothetical protein VE553_01795 [Candidatus Binatia bacterium]|jgi:hypothetical protein|nr:hypothetical protein [Candidatus Binatia bacterium]